MSAEIYSSYDDLLERVSRTGKPIAELGRTVDGASIISVKAGGDKGPPIFITAGSHSTEQAGVSAAVDLIECLDTDHAVYVIPTRDPVGMNGFTHALGLALGPVAEVTSFDEVEKILRDEGEILFEEDSMVLSLIGEYGYATNRPVEGALCPQARFYERLQRVYREGPHILEPLRGRRVYQVPGQAGVEGTGNFGRAYTLIIGLDGDILHINRFHDTAWAPVEPRVTRQLMEEIRPGISFDLHESQRMADRFWLSARHQMTAEDEEWEQRAAQVTMRAIADSGATLAYDDDMPSGWFAKSEQALFWLDATQRGEGLNLMDYASREHGLAFGTEMGMYGSFEQRVELALITVRTAVSVFEERFR